MKERPSFEARVIIIAPSGRDAVLAEQLLLANDLQPFLCATVDEMFKQIEQGAGAVLIASEVLTIDVIARLSHTLDRQPAWSDLSIIIITGAASDATRSNQLKELSALTNAVILERPIRSALIINSVKIALRARERQYVMRDHLVDRTRLEMQLADAYHKQYRIAETLQRSMLNLPPKGAFPGIDIETLYIAAKEEAEVGGDFFDVFAVDDTNMAIVVGDVSGKGLDAAARSLEVKYPLRSFLRSNADPGETLGIINNYLVDAQRLDPGATGGFVCICICVIDRKRRTMRWSSAGFEGPLFLRPHRSGELLEMPSPPVGVIGGYVYDNNERLIAADDTLILFTDGITESRNGRDFFGVEGLLHALECKATMDLSEIVHSAANAAMSFSNSPNADDVCIVAARILDQLGG